MALNGQAAMQALHFIHLFTSITCFFFTSPELARNIKETALCGLGQTAPNPVLSTLKYFRHEYEAHIKEKRCPPLTLSNGLKRTSRHAGTAFYTFSYINNMFLFHFSGNGINRALACT